MRNAEVRTGPANVNNLWGSQLSEDEDNYIELVRNRIADRDKISVQEVSNDAVRSFMEAADPEKAKKEFEKLNREKKKYVKKLDKLVASM